MPRLDFEWGASVRNSVSLPATTPNSGPPDVQSPATPRFATPAPALTPSSVTQRALQDAGSPCLGAEPLAGLHHARRSAWTRPARRHYRGAQRPARRGPRAGEEEE